jgi:hypothetical protein
LRIIFTSDAQYENEGPHKGPKFAKGDVFDFTADFAERWIRRFKAVLFGDEHPEVTVNSFEPVLTGQPIPDEAHADAAETADSLKAAVAVEAEIPANWETLGFFKLQAIAKAICGEKPADKAATVEVIKAELAKRAAA